MAKPKQLDSGLAKPTRHKAIEEAAEEYCDLRDARIAKLTKEIESKNKLLSLMHDHKLTVYRYDGKTVELLPTEKVKVKTDKEDDADKED